MTFYKVVRSLPRLFCLSDGLLCQSFWIFCRECAADWKGYDGDVCAFYACKVSVYAVAGGYPAVDIGCAVDGRAGLVCNRFDEKTGTQADLTK